MSLIGSLNSCSGNLHVQFAAHHGRVCGDPSWGLKEALVICKQLACGCAQYTYQHVLRPEETEAP